MDLSVQRDSKLDSLSIRRLNPEGLRGTGQRDARQQTVSTWCAAAFGPEHAASIPQRAVRLLEEAIEAYQACGCDPEMAHRLVDHVFAHPAGVLSQELGGVGVTTLALAEAAGLSADTAESLEIERVLAKPLEYFKARNEAKNAAGFSVQSPVSPQELMSSSQGGK